MVSSTPEDEDNELESASSDKLLSLSLLLLELLPSQSKSDSGSDSLLPTSSLDVPLLSSLLLSTFINTDDDATLPILPPRCFLRRRRRLSFSSLRRFTRTCPVDLARERSPASPLLLVLVLLVALRFRSSFRSNFSYLRRSFISRDSLSSFSLSSFLSFALRAFAYAPDTLPLPLLLLCLLFTLSDTSAGLTPAA